MRESLLHDSELGAGSTRVARLAVGQAPGGRAWSCMHWDLPACLPAAVRRRAARAAMPGMHWDLPACLAACMHSCMYGDSEVYCVAVAAARGAAAHAMSDVLANSGPFL